jgi:hypothetical protein
MTFIQQEHHRFYDDDGTNETDSTPLAAQDANISRVTGLNTLLRFSLYNSHTGSNRNNAYYFCYSLEGGGWANVEANSSVVCMSPSSKLVESSDCTQRLYGEGHSFDVTNSGQEDGDGHTATSSHFKNAVLEVVYCFQIRSSDVGMGSSITFCVYSAGTDTGFVTMATTPAITVINPQGKIYFWFQNWQRQNGILRPPGYGKVLKPQLEGI